MPWPRPRPRSPNSDQGSHVTSPQYLALLQAADVQMCMDGKGRALDNIFTERLWRTITYEQVYIRSYNQPKEARASLARYLDLYNHRRPHQALGYRTPAEVYFGTPDHTTRRGGEKARGTAAPATWKGGVPTLELPPQCLDRGVHYSLWKEQNGLCPVCHQRITTLTGWHNHHIVWRTHGGSDTTENRVLLHPNCHRQVHSQGLTVVKPRLATGV